RYSPVASTASAPEPRHVRHRALSSGTAVAPAAIAMTSQGDPQGDGRTLVVLFLLFERFLKLSKVRVRRRAFRADTRAVTSTHSPAGDQRAARPAPLRR